MTVKLVGADADLGSAANTLTSVVETACAALTITAELSTWAMNCCADARSAVTIASV